MKKVIIILTMLATDSYAGSGTTAANFLKFAVSAREASLAGAYSAVGDDSASIFANPAGINYASGKELGFGFASFLQDSKIGIISYVSDYQKAKIGFGLSAYNIDSIERRGLTDLSGVMGESGTFSATDMAFYLSYARKDAIDSFMENTDFGASVKVINSKIDSESAMAGAIDFGFIHRYSDEIKISIMLANAGTNMKYKQESDPLPINLRAGMAYKTGRTNLICEASEYFKDEKFYPSLAIEHELREGFVIRGGYKFGYDRSNLGSYVGANAGFGIKTSGIGLDYAYSPFGDLGDIHRFDFKIKF